MVSIVPSSCVAPCVRGRFRSPLLWGSAGVSKAAPRLGPLRALAASFYQGPLLVNGDDGDDGGSDDGIHGANANDHAD